MVPQTEKMSFSNVPRLQASEADVAVARYKAQPAVKDRRQP